MTSHILPSDSRCSICGLTAPVSGTPLCHQCTEIRACLCTERVVLVVDGSWSPDHPTIGGAGLVLVDGGPAGKIVGQCRCGFHCCSSQRAEYEAILRGRHLTSRTLIFSDAKFVVRRLQGYRKTRATIGQQVRFLRQAPHLRGDAYRHAHHLSVQGRQAFVAMAANDCASKGVGTSKP